MAVCPKCRYEYKPHVSVCPDCGAALVARDQLPPAEGHVDPELAKQGFVSVYRAAEKQSVRRIRSALEAEGIRATVRSFEVSEYDDVFKHPSGAWGEVLVLERDAQRAAEIIEVVETGTIVSDDATEGETRSPAS